MAITPVKNVKTQGVGFAPILRHYFVRCGIERIIDENVTVMVHSDWSAICCWYRQNMEASTDGPVKAKRQKKRQMEACKGPQCEHVTGYRDRLLAEERQRTEAQGS